jgi:hypothetical protein
MSETGELFERIERVINAADVGAKLAPDIHRDWMTGARLALAILRCRVTATTEAVDGASTLAVAAEQAAAEQRGADRERAAIAGAFRLRAKTLRSRKALGLAEEVDALAFYVEQRGGGVA